jgi:dihydrofolate synthase / folylpolyglutamate synthase
MQVTPLQTQTVRAGAISLTELIDQTLLELPERSILVIASKVVALCEGRVVPVGAADREDLIRQEADYYLPASFSSYGHHFAIKAGTIVGSAGIDQSNGDGNYVLWPADPQATANAVRAHVRTRFGVQDVGVLITDSASHPLRLGAMGVALAHSGFLTIHDYIGQDDLYRQPFKVERANISGGLAAAASVAMGEGDERMPLCVLSDLPFVTFQEQDPDDHELAAIHMSLEDDLFAPFLQAAPWQRGAGGSQAPEA